MIVLLSELSCQDQIRYFVETPRIRLMSKFEFTEKSEAVLAELRRALGRVDAKAFEDFASALAAAKRVILHGLGREGLQMKGLAMRLYHLGLDAHVVGEMTTPPVGMNDLLLVSSGPGDFASIRALIGIAKAAGAKIAVVTGVADSRTAREADHVLRLPAQTMATDLANDASHLPMGSLFEVAMMLTFELLALRIRDLRGETAETMRARHTNME
jgi:6-phospho-3-hexuloisomerase